MFPVHRVAPPVRAGVALLALLALAAIDAQAFVPAGTNASDSRWQSTASGSTGQAGDPITLTWGFANDGTQTLEPDSQTSRVPSDLIASFDSQFGAGPGGGDLTQRPWFIFFEQSFDRLSDLMGVTFQYEPNDDGTNHGFLNGLIGVRADVRIAGISMDGSGGTLAYNYFPNGGGGDMALDTDDLSGFANSANNYRFLRNIVMHEMGHGLGLEHSSSNNANFLMEATINTSFDGPQHDDLRGFHWMYGDALEKTNSGAGNDTAALATALGALAAGGSLAIGEGGTGTVVGGAETDFVSVSNENDPDYFSFTITEPVRVDALMTPRGASFNQGATPFDTTSTSDLELALFDTNGVSLLGESASGASGVNESIDGLLLDTPGTYYARVQSQSGASGQVTQFYQLDLTAESVVPSLLGDFNDDGLVDAADYTVWRDTLGQSVDLYSGADHDGNGLVDAGDYSVWQNNFGASAPGFASAVPEPQAILMLFGAIFSGIVRKNRR